MYLNKESAKFSTRSSQIPRQRWLHVGLRGQPLFFVSPPMLILPESPAVHLLEESWRYLRASSSKISVIFTRPTLPLNLNWIVTANFC